MAYITREEYDSYIAQNKRIASAALELQAEHEALQRRANGLGAVGRTPCEFVGVGSDGDLTFCEPGGYGEHDNYFFITGSYLYEDGWRTDLEQRIREREGLSAERNRAAAEQEERASRQLYLRLKERFEPAETS